jgi:hypothetical protein
VSKGQLYEVEIKSKALLREGKNGLITYFRGGQKKTIASNVRKIYPQYTDPVDAPVVNITPISFRDYEQRKNGGEIRQKQHLINQRVDINGTLEN